MTSDKHQIPARERALILAADILDDPNTKDSEIALLAWQLTDAQKEIEELNAKLKHLKVISQ